jgi:hypothetical protein
MYLRPYFYVDTVYGTQVESKLHRNYVRKFSNNLKIIKDIAGAPHIHLWKKNQDQTQTHLQDGKQRQFCIKYLNIIHAEFIFLFHQIFQMSSILILKLHMAIAYHLPYAYNVVLLFEKFRRNYTWFWCKLHIVAFDLLFACHFLRPIKERI